LPQNIEASSFISSLGVNVHLNFSGTAYQNVSGVENAMKFLGLNAMRDMGAQNAAVYDTMANAGFKFDFFAPGGQYELDVGTLTQRLHSFAANHPGSIVSLEGANEVNNWPLTYNGMTGNAGAAAYQQAFFNAASGDSLLNPIKMINLSIGSGSQSAYNGLGDMSHATDLGNVHVYMSNGNQPNVEMSRLMSYAQAVTPGLPMSITETGYPTLASDTAQGVDEATQAKLTLNTVLDAAKLGVASTYLYELVDDPYSGGGAWNNGGLFHADWTPKPAATALHNLTTILTTSSGAAATSAAPSYTVSGLDGYHADMSVHESNGTYDIVLWREPDIWDSNSHTEIKANTETATIQLSQGVSGYTVYDPITGTSAIGSGGAGSTIQVQMTDHPLIIELHGGATGASTTPPAATTAPPTTSSTPPATTTTPPATTTAAPATTTAGVINGTAGADTLWGTSGHDTIQAAGGNDVIYGGSGSELIKGGAGDDLLYGKGGADTLTGGTGHDHFVFDTAISSGVGTITDFNVSEDTIYLDHKVFTALSTGGLSSGAFQLGTGAHDSSDHVIYNRATGDLMYDADGTGAAHAQTFAHLSPWLNLGASNFVVF
jgi:hypothetical protein